MFQKIQEVLGEIEASEGVRVLYACESGSRAWGFESSDSDFDVRFIYIHRPEWYLSIELEHKRDVIERPIVDELDVNGWDLRKALALLRRSNPPLLEWLGSPIVYRESAAPADAMRSLALEHYSLPACMYHYLHMARGNFREYLRGQEVWIKKYLYVLRPLLAIRWLERGLGVVPTEFEKLLTRVVDEPETLNVIRDLLHKKRRGLEIDRGPRIDVISSFIESELERLEEVNFGEKPPPPPVEPFDRVFRETLMSSWHNGWHNHWPD